MITRRLVPLATLFALLVLFGTISAWAAEDYDDDSMITVIVEQDADENDSNDGVVYVFPDDFIDHLPPPIVLPPASLPGGGGDGGPDASPAPEPEPPCDELLDDFNEAARRYWHSKRLGTKIIYDGGQDGYYPGVPIGSSEYFALLKDVQTIIALDEAALFEAADRWDEECGEGKE